MKYFGTFFDAGGALVGVVLGLWVKTRAEMPLCMALGGGTTLRSLAVEGILVCFFICVKLTSRVAFEG
jgi:hypothetical protein